MLCNGAQYNCAFELVYLYLCFYIFVVVYFIFAFVFLYIFICDKAMWCDGQYMLLSHEPFGIQSISLPNTIQMKRKYICNKKEYLYKLLGEAVPTFLLIH